MDEIKKNEISADTLKMRVKAGLDRQKDAAKSIREEDKPNIIENAAEDYSLEKQDNPYVNLSVDDIIGQFMTEEDMKFFRVEDDTEIASEEKADEIIVIDEAAAEASAEEIADEASADDLAADEIAEIAEIIEAVQSEKTDSIIMAENDDELSNIPADYALGEQLDDDIEGNGVQSVIAENRDELSDDDLDSEAMFEIAQIVQNEAKKKKKKKKKKKAETALATVDGEESAELTDVNGDGVIDETDLKLMMAFDMNEELENTGSVEKINSINEEIEQHEHEIEDGIKEKKPFKLNFEIPEFLKTKKREEYTAVGQISGIFAEFRREYSILLIRMLAAIVLLIVAFFFENLNIFGGSLPAGVNMSIFPVVHCMLDLQMIILACLLIPKQIISGFSAAIKLKPIPESMTVLTIIMSVIYTLISCFAKSGNTLKMYGFAVILCVFLTLLYEFFNKKREIQNFNVLASKKQKHVIEAVDDDQAELEREAFAEVLPDEPELFKITKTSFVDGFFSRLDVESKHRKILDILLPAGVGVFVLFTVIAAFFTKDFISALSFGCSSALFVLPFSVFITYAYPFFKAVNEAYAVESTIIGEDSIEKYSHASVVSFEDKDVFPPYGVKVKQVKVYGESRIDYVIYNAASVFMTIGGPLSDVFEVATRDLGHSDNVEILAVESNGIEALIDGVHVYIGKAPYIRGNGFTLPRDANGVDEESSGEICVMYMTMGDQLAAKMYVQYVIDPDFEPLLKQLYRTGVCVGIKTFDPNINDQMLSTRIRISKYPVKIIKVKTKGERPEVEPHVDSGIVSKGSSKSLLQALSLCERVTNATKNALIVKMFSLAISVIVSILLLIFAKESVNSFYVALYQIFWIVPTVLLTKLSIGKL